MVTKTTTKTATKKQTNMQNSIVKYRPKSHEVTINIKSPPQFVNGLVVFEVPGKKDWETREILYSEFIRFESGSNLNRLTLVDPMHQYITEGHVNYLPDGFVEILGEKLGQPVTLILSREHYVLGVKRSGGEPVSDEDRKAMRGKSIVKRPGGGNPNLGLRVKPQAVAAEAVTANKRRTPPVKKDGF